MRPKLWNPPVNLSQTEEKVISRLKKSKLFSFLREVRHLLFDEEFQAELGGMYALSNKGYPPVPPAQLALAVILQAYTQASDAEAIEALTMDKRWQLVLNCLDCEEAPFCQATLVRFRQALIIHQLDRRLIERTVELGAKTKKFGARNLRVALDSSPLWGAGKVEDTYNLLGHALRKALSVIAHQQGRELTEIADETGGGVCTGKSLKSALDLDWDEPDQREQALATVLETLDQVETALEKQLQEYPEARCSLEAAHQVMEQDTEVDNNGRVQLKKGVAKERRISLEDPEMRHGRKSRSQKINGYKRHIVKDLDSGMVVAAGITAANAAEATVTRSLSQDLAHQGVQLVELHIDRAYLSSSWVTNRDETLTVYCKAWPVRNGDKFTKNAFTLDWEQQTITCPNQVSMPFVEGGRVQFPADRCNRCPLQERCTSSERGRSVSIHSEEKFFAQLRERQSSQSGRAKLRERVAVEHSLSHIGRWQSDKARYIGSRKNLFDLRRTVVVHNLHVLARSIEQVPEYLPLVRTYFT